MKINKAIVASGSILLGCTCLHANAETAVTTHTGYGMGLAIVDRITHWHNGTICIETSESLGGARFTLQLPRV